MRDAVSEFATSLPSKEDAVECLDKAAIHMNMYRKSIKEK